jgi:hypothetical protein
VRGPVLLPTGAPNFHVGIGQVQTAVPYEPAANGLNLSHLYLGGLHSAYVRGEALIAAHRYAEAAAEFQKILDRRGIVGLDPIGALAHLHLGRAYALIGKQGQGKECVPGFPETLEGRRCRHPGSQASQSGIRQAAVNLDQSQPSNKRALTMLTISVLLKRR